MDTQELIRYLITPSAQVALIIGLAEICKKMGIKTRYIPLVDLGLGLVSGLAVYGIHMKYGITEGILLGIALGLGACGLFSAVKNVADV